MSAGTEEVATQNSAYAMMEDTLRWVIDLVHRANQAGLEGKVIRHIRTDPVPGSFCRYETVFEYEEG